MSDFKKDFSAWLEEHDEKQGEREMQHGYVNPYLSPRTGMVDYYQARFDDMLAAAEFAIQYAKENKLSQ